MQCLSCSCTGSAEVGSCSSQLLDDLSWEAEIIINIAIFGTDVACRFAALDADTLTSRTSPIVNIRSVLRRLSAPHFPRFRLSIIQFLFSTAKRLGQQGSIRLLRAYYPFEYTLSYYDSIGTCCRMILRTVSSVTGLEYHLAAANPPLDAPTLLCLRR